MTPVARTQSFTFRGQRVEFEGNMKLLRKLRDVCLIEKTTLTGVATSIASGQPDPIALSSLATVMLQTGGHAATEDDCYSWVATGGGGNADELAEFMAALLGVIFPDVDPGKKPEGQPQPPAVKAKKQK